MISQKKDTNSDVFLEQEEYPEFTGLELAEYSFILAAALTIPPPAIREGDPGPVHRV